ncbi:MAG TPA: hypothetical protein PLF98_07970, partial [Thermotogota bacterium]|nr:hypothetical protein [Thermotogota bacterium]
YQGGSRQTATLRLRRHDQGIPASRYRDGMLDLLKMVGSTHYRELLQSLRSGYEKLMEWPEGNLEVL